MEHKDGGVRVRLSEDGRPSPPWTDLAVYGIWATLTLIRGPLPSLSGLLRSRAAYDSSETPPLQYGASPLSCINSLIMTWTLCLNAK